MRKSGLAALAICHFALYTGVSSSVGLLPIYLALRHVNATNTGFFLAFAYLGLAAGNVVGGRLADHFQRQKVLLILGGLLAVPLTLLMRSVTTVILLMLLTGCLWFATGTAMATINLLVGLHAKAGDRERAFGVLSLSANLGLLFGNLVSGRIVDRWGYPTLFLLLGLFYLVVPIAGSFMPEAKVMRRSSDTARPAFPAIFASWTFRFLFLASIVGQAANCVVFLSRTLNMHALHFDTTTITTASAVGSMVTLPLPLVVGWLSRRLGRKPIIVGCFLSASLSIAVVAQAVALWQFWLASALATGIGASLVLGSALVTEISPKESLGTSLSLLNATPWIGIIIGLSGGGVAIAAFQMTPALTLDLLLSLVAVLLLAPVASHKSKHPVKTA